MRLRSWLMLGYSAVLALATLGLGLGLITATGLAATSGRMVHENFAALDVASRLRTLTSAQQLVLLRRLAERDASVAQLLPPFDREARALLQQARTLGGRTRSDRDAIERIDQAIARVIVAVSDAAAAMLRDGRSDDASASTDETVGGITTAVVSGFESLRAATHDYYVFHHVAMVERGERIQRQADRLAIALGLLAAFTVLVGVLVSLRLAARLSAPMERLAAAAARVAQGDFEVRLDRTGLHEADLLAQRFDEMTAALGRFHAMNLDRIVAESRRLDQVVANIDDGLLIFDETGRIERVNPVAAAMLRIDADAVVGAHLDALELLPRIAQEIDRLVADPRAPLGTDSDIELDDGDTRRTLSYSLLPFSDMARRGLILVLRDVTEERKFERMRTDFVLRASHELRTPITGMRMALGLLEGKYEFPVGSREAELLDTLGEEMQRLVNLITALLDLSRLYAHKYDLVRKPARLQDLLQRAHARFKPQAETAGVTLSHEVDSQLPSISIDSSAIERVLDNLIGNAIRHTPRDGRIALVATRGETSLEVSVSDTGEGIAHADMARVFEPFVQIGKRAGGVGLGLAMCREIVHQHGGQMRLDATLGQGCRFSFSLPL